MLGVSLSGGRFAASQNHSVTNHSVNSPADDESLFVFSAFLRGESSPTDDESLSVVSVPSVVNPSPFPEVTHNVTVMRIVVGGGQGSRPEDGG